MAKEIGGKEKLKEGYYLWDCKLRDENMAWEEGRTFEAGEHVRETTEEHFSDLE